MCERPCGLLCGFSLRPWSGGLLLVTILVSGCGSAPLDVTSALTVSDVTTGWLDAGIDDLGQNKLVPTISFRLRNISDNHVRTLQLQGLFFLCLPHQAGQPEPVSERSPANAEAGTCAGESHEWHNAYIGTAVGREGLEAGEAAGPFTMESRLGYTGEQSRIEMLQNRHFVDVKVELWIKHRTDNWIRLTEYPIDRQLLTQ